jgi:hypothetical protein
MTMIKVLYINKTSGTVEDLILEELIATGKIVAFSRSSEWIVIGRDPIRGMGGEYDGPERRKKGKALAAPSDFFG